MTPPPKTSILSSVANPLNASVFGMVWSPELGRVVAGGRSLLATNNVMSSDNDGATWTGQGNLAGGGNVFGFAWGAGVPAFVGATAQGVVVSATGTGGWAYHVVGAPDYFFPVDVEWSALQARFVLVGLGYSYSYGPPTNVIYTSPDGVVWTGQGVPTSIGDPQSVTFSPTLALWVVVDDFGQVYTSPTALAGTWTRRTTPFANTGAFDSVRWFDTAAKFVACGSGGGAAGTVTMIASTNGTTWTTIRPPPNVGEVTDVAESSGIWFATGSTADGYTLVSSTQDGGTTWVRCITDADGSGADPRCAITITPSTELLVGLIALGSGFTVLRGTVVAPGAPPTPRYFDGHPWRFVFANIPDGHGDPGGTSTTWANGIQTNRSIMLTFNQPSTINLDVKSDDSQVNSGFPASQNELDYRLVSQSNRIVYAFRREGPGTSVAGRPADEPWKIRAAGIVMVIEDESDDVVPVTHVTAYDPWQILAARLLVDADGEPPNPAGAYSWAGFGDTGAEIIGNALKFSIASPTGGFAYIDAGPLYGGTVHWGGHFDTTLPINLQFQQGQSVADAWNTVIQTGFCDIVLTPIYDPENRPGYTHELSVYNLAGDDKPGTVFGYDRDNRDMMSVSRLHDATPSNFSNSIQYFVGQGGPGALAFDNASILDFGYYWAAQFFPDFTYIFPGIGSVIDSLARQALYMQRQGQRTVTMTLTPQRAPVPLVEYNVGDRVGLWATKRLRAPISSSFLSDPPAAFRVQAIPIAINDDGVETVSGLVVSPDWRTNPIDLLPAGFDDQLASAGRQVAVDAAALARNGTRAVRSILKRPFR